jgi:serine/threonine protein kinase
MRRSLFDLHVGEAFGRYELMVPVAEGGMSRVWAARLSGTRGFQKVVGIKTLATEGPDRERLEKMLLAEARLAAQIHHPNVAQYLDLGERNGVLFVVMEWVDGESLTALLKHAGRSQRMPLPIAAQIVAQACNGLHGAHELCDPAGEPLGLVHCDVSPHNLMISASGAVKLIDFGIASATRGAPMAGQQGLVAGKLAFMAPEQARGYAVDRRADVFSLGIVLYLLTTGRHPFGFGTPGETLQRIVRNAPVIPPCAADPEYPPALERIVLRALAHDREHRFATTAEMLYELSAAVPLAHEMEVGQYLQAVCGDSLRVRRTAIAEALEQATQRDDRESSPLPLISVAQKPAPPFVLSDGNQQATTTAPAAADVLLYPDFRPRGRRLRYLGLLAALGIVAGVVAFRGHWLPPLAIPGLASTPTPAGAPTAAARAAIEETRPAASEASKAGDTPEDAAPVSNTKAAPNAHFRSTRKPRKCGLAPCKTSSTRAAAAESPDRAEKPAPSARPAAPEPSASPRSIVEQYGI